MSMRDVCSKAKTAILGPGKVGGTLGVLMERAGYRIEAIGGRDLQSAREAADRLQIPPLAVSLDEAVREADLVLLTVSDDAIEAVCRELSSGNEVKRGSIWLHCSGALPAAIMAALHTFGCSLGAMHPLQTFPSVEAGLERVPGSLFACEGEERAIEAAMQLAEAIGGKPVRLRAKGKQLYHAAAVLACNGLVSLMDAALELEAAAELPPVDALEGLEKILQSTLSNIRALGTTRALTGPVARGDHRTIRKQLSELRDLGKPEIVRIYRALNLRALDIAMREGKLPPDQAREIADALENS